MICPECGGEFVEGVVTCADCEVPLVPALPEPEATSSPRSELDPEGRWAVLFQTDHVAEADLAAAALEAAGIPHYLAECEPGDLSLDLPLPAALGPGTWWVIHVPEAYVEEAQSVLEEQPEELEEVGAPPAAIDPGAKPKPQLNRLVLAYLVLLGFFVVWTLLSLFRELFP